MQLSIFVLSAVGSDYYPLTIGNTWDYDAYDSSGNIGGYTLTVVRDTTVSTMKVFVLSGEIAITFEGIFFDTTFIGHLADVNNDVLSMGDPAKPNSLIKFAQHQYSDGDFWSTAQGDTSRVSYFGALDTPAGPFDSCYTVENSYGDINYFAPHVGLVRIVGGTFRYELGGYWVEPTVVGEYEIASQTSNILRAFPNPFRVHTTFSFANPQKDVQVTIFDIVGRRILKKQGIKTSVYVWNPRNLAPGVYVAKISDGQNIYSKKILFQR